MKQEIVIFGTGEIAEMAYFYMSNDPHFEHKIVAFTCDDEYAKDSQFMGLPLVPLSQMLEKYPASTYGMHVALSYNKLNRIRKAKYIEVKAMGYELVSYVCSKSVYWPDLSIGDNCFILENQTIQPKVKIGNNVMIWSGNHLGHGCQIGDHTYLSSHICISGYTKFGECCFVGVNSAFKDYITIEDDVFIAMGANVTGNISEGSVVLGPKMNAYDKEQELTKKLRKNYLNLED